MDISSVLKEAEESMAKAVDYMIHEFASIRTGKASPALIENLDVLVSAYGSQMKLKQLAMISSPEPRMLLVQPFDASTTRDIERAIRESTLGLNPSAADRSIRVPIPELSEERRKDFVKVTKKYAEEARVRLRSCRKEGIDALKKLKTDSLVTEDDQRTTEDKIQKLTDKFVKIIDEHAQTKEKEIMKI